MNSEPNPETSNPAGEGDPVDSDANSSEGQAVTELPVALTEFTQRLASFGLGETPDPLLTDARPPTKRRSLS